MSMPISLRDRPASTPRPSSDGATLETLAPPRAEDWSQLGPGPRLRFLKQLRDATERLSRPWADLGNQLRGISEGDEAQAGLAATGWLSGPTYFAGRVAGYLQTYGDCALRGCLPPLRAGRRPHTARATVEVFPRSPWDRAAWPWVRGELWLGRDGAQKRRSPLAARSPRVTLVLCASNFEAPVDVLHQLFGLGHGVVLKPSPKNDALVPIYEQVFAPLIDAGYLRIAPSDLETTRSLLRAPWVDEVMLTGSLLTYNRIVWGADRPGTGPRHLAKPITAELGGVSPYILVPGRWSPADVTHHARQLAAAKVWNAGHSCGSPQVLVTSRRWQQRGQFLDQLQHQLSVVPKPPSYFAGADERCAELVREQPGARCLPAPSPRASPTWFVPDAGRDPAVLRREAFGSALVEVCLDAVEPGPFLEEATAFCNEQLMGCLCATLVIDPRSRASAAPAFERALDRLEFGAIGVNIFGLLVNAIPQLGWGAHGHGDGTDIQSGCGRLAGTDLVSGEEKSVLLSPFRSLAHFQPLEPKMRRVAPALMRQSLRPSIGHYLSLMRAAAG